MTKTEAQARRIARDYKNALANGAHELAARHLRNYRAAVAKLGFDPLHR